MANNGLLSGIFGSTPDAPAPVKLDPSTQQIINAQTQNAGQDSSAFTNSLNQNVDAGKGLLENPAIPKQAEASQGGSSATDYGAIRNMYAKQARQQINNVSRQNSIQGSLRKADYMNQTAKALLGQQAAETNQFKVLTDAYAQQEASRAQFVSSLAGLANAGIIAAKTAPKGSPTNSIQTTQGPTWSDNSGSPYPAGSIYNVDPGATYQYA